jgi:SAM-dependent methyltransferase
LLDVGAGTGIASQQLLERGVDVLAVEPDPRMAEIAKEEGISIEIGTTTVALRILSPRKVNQSDSASLTRLLIAAVAIAEARRCFACSVAGELAECGRVRYTDARCDGCAGEFGVRYQAFGLQQYASLDDVFRAVATRKERSDGLRRPLLRRRRTTTTANPTSRSSYEAETASSYSRTAPAESASPPRPATMSSSRRTFRTEKKIQIPTRPP